MLARFALISLFFMPFSFAQMTVGGFGITTRPSAGELVECQAGFWRAGRLGTEFEFAIVDTELLSTHSGRLQQGYHLQDMEVRVGPNGNQYYDVFWQEGSASQSLALNLSWAEMGDEIAREELNGKLLVDLEVFEVDGQRRFSAMFEARQGSQQVTDGFGISESVFMAHNSSMAQQGYRIADFEVFRVAGVLFYHAVWHEGSGAYFFGAGEDWLDFHQTFHDKNPQNLRLIDFESYVENGVARYIGYWGPGQDNDHFLMVPGPVDMDKATPNSVKSSMSLIDYEILFEDPGKRTLHGKRGHHGHHHTDQEHTQSSLHTQSRGKWAIIDEFAFDNTSIITSMIHNGGSVGPGN